MDCLQRTIYGAFGVMQMNEHVRIYWDACAWLGLLNGEQEKRAALEHVWEKAKKGDIQIWTSAFCIAEVYRLKCEKQWASLCEENDAKIENMFNQDFVRIVQVDIEIAKLAKRLLRFHEKLNKPSDAIHLATAVFWDLDQFHTYDGSDLLGLSVITNDGRPLNICKPDMIDGPNLFNYENRK